MDPSKPNGVAPVGLKGSKLDPPTVNELRSYTAKKERHQNAACGWSVPQDHPAAQVAYFPGL